MGLGLAMVSRLEVTIGGVASVGSCGLRSKVGGKSFRHAGLILVWDSSQSESGQQM